MIYNDFIMIYNDFIYYQMFYIYKIINLVCDFIYLFLFIFKNKYVFNLSNF